MSKIKQRYSQTNLKVIKEKVIEIALQSKYRLLPKIQNNQLKAGSKKGSLWWEERKASQIRLVDSRETELRWAVFRRRGGSWIRREKQREKVAECRDGQYPTASDIKESAQVEVFITAALETATLAVLTTELPPPCTSQKCHHWWENPKNKIILLESGLCIA